MKITDPVSRERLQAIVREPANLLARHHRLAVERKSMAAELLSARQALCLRDPATLTDGIHTILKVERAQHEEERAKLIEALKSIREHVFAQLTPETSPPRNRLQVIAAMVDNALADIEHIEQDKE